MYGFNVGPKLYGSVGRRSVFHVINIYRFGPAECRSDERDASRQTSVPTVPSPAAFAAPLARVLTHWHHRPDAPSSPPLAGQPPAQRQATTAHGGELQPRAQARAHTGRCAVCQ